MSKNSTSEGGAGLGICEVVGIVFVILKLCKVIDWSWWIVLLPIYAPIILAFLVFGIFVLAVAIANRKGR